MSERVAVSPAGDVFRVVVEDGSGSTSHSVSVPEAYVSKIGLAGVDPVRLVEESFRFLLEREPKGSIMRTFALDVIERYFDDYPDEIRRRLAAS